MSLQADQRREAYRRMLSIRRFEEALPKRIAAGEIPGAVHSSVGQEATLVGACMALRDDDYITGTHRSHGHPIAKGARLAPLMAELMARATGVCKGRGGSMHLADTSVGIIGESAIVGGGIPLATGAGLSAFVRGTDQVSIAFFGDGAANQGVLYECLNMAAIWKLPVLYALVNNGYAISMPVGKGHASADIVDLARGYGMPCVIVDGNDIELAYAEVQKAIDYIRAGNGPYFLEFKTWRWQGLFSGEFRPAEEVKYWKEERDPLKLARETILEQGKLSAEDLERIEAEVKAQIETWIDFAKASPMPDAAKATANVYVGWEVAA